MSFDDVSRSEIVTDVSCAPAAGWARRWRRLEVEEGLRHDVADLICDDLVGEDCAHTWRQFTGLCRGERAARLLAWEHDRRPTTFFTYFGVGHEGRVPWGVATVAGQISASAPPTIAVIARSYIRPRYRGLGLYRTMFAHRVERCVAGGARVQAIHFGTTSERVLRAARGFRHPEFAPFLRFGEQTLDLGCRSVKVGVYFSLRLDLCDALRRDARAFALGGAPAESSRFVDLVDRALAAGAGSEWLEALRSLVERIGARNGRRLDRDSAAWDTFLGGLNAISTPEAKS